MEAWSVSSLGDVTSFGRLVLCNMASLVSVNLKIIIIIIV